MLRKHTAVHAQVKKPLAIPTVPLRSLGARGPTFTPFQGCMGLTQRHSSGTKCESGLEPEYKIPAGPRCARRGEVSEPFVMGRPVCGIPFTELRSEPRVPGEGIVDTGELKGSRRAGPEEISYKEIACTKQEPGFKMTRASPTLVKSVS